MSKERFWYGFLDAGDRSSPVLRDDTLNTGNPETVYMFNLQRKEVIEYKTDIVQPRLKELDDENTISELTAAYMVCKAEFKPKNQAKPITETEASEPAPKKGPEKDENFDDLASSIADGEDGENWDDDE